MLPKRHRDSDESDDENILQRTDEDLSVNQVEINTQIPVFTRPTDRPQEKCIYESLDYEVIENDLWHEEREKRPQSFEMWKDFFRWLIFISIGVSTALVACLINILIEEFSDLKYNFLKHSVDSNVINGDLAIPYLFWMLLNIIPVLIGSVLVTYVEPIAGGSGIPQVKCYLNGVKIPRLIRIKTLAVKVVGVATSVIGGLAGGKEGPMIHSGAIIAAGISQGKSTTFNKDFGVLRYFRDDHEKRDFVVGGAAAGVAAAFGAPFGGVIFSLEEVASFWNQLLIWRTMVASVISSFVLNIVLSAYYGQSSLVYPGLFNLGKFEPLPFTYLELPIFVCMGVIGGLQGALWNFVNIKLYIFRTKYVTKKWEKVLDALFIAALSATFGSILMYSLNDCKPLGNDPIKYPVQLFCEDNEYNAVAALWFQTPEASVKSLFHDPPGSHKILSLALFVLVYYPLSCLTFGLNVSLGIFIPMLLVGAGWGRLTGMTITSIFPTMNLHPGKYALIGAAAQLGGVLRMTISLSVILIESTGNISFAFPLIVTLITAKWVGDYFNEGIYDTQIAVWRVPMLPWSLEPMFQKLNAYNIMNTPVVTIKLRAKAKYIYDILKNNHYNGFPVVDDNGCLRGLILRWQLVVILTQKLFVEKKRFWEKDVSIETFRKEYPRYPSISDVKLHMDKRDYTVDLKMFMKPSPHSITKDTSVPRIFQLFRALGLRHLPVVSVNNEVVGIITRKDFLKYHNH
ncbi:H(+)/Cl(-) exchange transporter 7 [Lutzomyia longipalpis]|nr:H(+)/Cl(-) exchange transporter 7 [Lutzomyia longipalpis]